MAPCAVYAVDGLRPRPPLHRAGLRGLAHSIVSSFFFGLVVLVALCSLVLYIALGEHDFQFPLPTSEAALLWLGMLACTQSAPLAASCGLL